MEEGRGGGGGGGGVLWKLCSSALLETRNPLRWVSIKDQMTLSLSQGQT